jgi:hypothetical protein
MSAGPIRAEREAHRVPRVSTTNANRVCRATPGGHAYCGRHSAPLVSSWDEVTCADCLAARRADTPPAPKIQGAKR